MRLTRDQVGHLAQQIVRGLFREEMIIAEQPMEITEIFIGVITKDLEEEDRLNEEVRHLLENYSEEISRGMVNYQDLFRKVKSKLARERKIVI